MRDGYGASGIERGYGQTDYSTYTHQQLYSAVMASDPNDVKHYADSHENAMRQLFELADSLTVDLTALGKVWQGEAFSTFRTRVGSIATFANALAEDFGDSQLTLNALVPELTKARQEMPNPADSEPAPATAAVGPLPGGNLVSDTINTVATTIADLLDGDSADQDAAMASAKKSAAQKLAAEIVTRLASEIGSFAPSNQRVPAPAPRDLPTGVNSGNPGTGRVPQGPPVNTGKVPTGAGGPVNRRQYEPETVSGGDPNFGGTPDGGALAGGPGGFSPGTIGPGGIGDAGRSSTGSPLGGAAFGGISAAGIGALGSGLLGPRIFGGSGSGGGLAGTQRPPGGIGAGNGQPGAGARPAGGTGPLMRGAHRDEERGREYETWLTEDEDFWNGDGSVPPPVLGGYVGTAAPTESPAGPADELAAGAPSEFEPTVADQAAAYSEFPQSMASDAWAPASSHPVTGVPAEAHALDPSSGVGTPTLNPVDAEPDQGPADWTTDAVPAGGPEADATAGSSASAATSGRSTGPSNPGAITPDF